MNFAAVLTTVATLIVHKPVVVHCNAPAQHPVWTGRVWGWSDMRKNVWLRHCDLTYWEYGPAVVVFAHELLHILHPDWQHPRVYRVSYVFAPRVRLVIDRVERRH